MNNTTDNTKHLTELDVLAAMSNPIYNEDSYLGEAYREKVKAMFYQLNPSSFPPVGTNEIHGL